MTRIDSADYPPVIGELLNALPLAPLGPGKPHLERLEKLQAAAGSFPPGADQNLASACMAGLWLGFDFLDESHTISQDLSTTEGSYWHALMHRREPDHGNCAYWLRRVGTHPIFGELAREAAEIGYRVKSERWGPFAFNDDCEKHRGKGDSMEDLLRRVQRIEWELLFKFCYDRAVGRP
jgi:hypothetical protein